MTSVIFMGTPQFAATILEGVIAADYDVKAVVTQPDRYTGRKRILTASPVKQVAVRHDIPVYQPQKLGKSVELAQLIAIQPDVIITAAFGQFLPMSLINSAKIAAVNVHGSLLPKYRGGAPVQYAIMNGDDKTGVTLIYMIKKMDAGEMLAQAELPILQNDDNGTIFSKMSLLGRTVLIEMLPKIISKEITGTMQDEAAVTFAPVISPEQEKLSLDLTAQQLDYMIRALRPQPGSYFEKFLNKRTKLWDIKPLDEKTEYEPGVAVFVGKNELKVAAAQGSVYKIREIQPAGKPRMTINNFLNGQGQGIKAGQRIITNE
ncbi:methionyl-tRNA formyltransferase [Lactobacillus sp. UCMA15818]|uniref:methionyl-tRNA formyltransferase n=1 Tax=Lactobacillus sp. UCMA15818 TaxID=2583394 RepID=UPI0025B1B89D|nr:methionyl-tRNA formyltransferase [Lactobacillus sp. UCMA15818]MDN2452585.1 methionyl-tRNA formyltransferase [Lactobacillus sp. UCMA15818]